MGSRMCLRGLNGKQFSNIPIRNLLGLILWVSGAVLSNSQSSWASEESALETQQLLEVDSILEKSDLAQSVTSMPNSSQRRPPAATVKEWLAQTDEVAIIEINGIQSNPTGSGIGLTLQTSGNLTEPTISVANNTLTVVIPNAVLVLPEGDSFEQVNPTIGIAQIQVTNLQDDRVQVMITGTDAPPTTQVNTESGQLVLSVKPGVTQAEEDSELDITVTAVRQEENGYRVPDVTTATRTDTPLRDIPQSVQVVPQQVIEDQGITRIGDALRNVSGVTPQRDRADITDRFSIRGFDQSRILRNGFRSGTPLGPQITTSPNVVEKIEVLKGPASVLYGQVEPGGVINFVTKKPLDEPFYNLKFTAGSFGFIEPAIDISGPLTTNKNLTYRLNASYQNGGNFRDFVESEIISIAPTIRYKFSEDTNLTFEYEYLQANRTFDDGLPIDPVVFELPRERFLGEPDDFANTTTHSFNLTLNHRFNDNINLRSAFSAELTDRSTSAFRLLDFDAESGEFSRFFNAGSDSGNNYAWQTDLVSEFDTGPVEHKLLIGFELARSTDSDEFSGFNDFDADIPLPINVFNPRYNTARPEARDAFGDGGSKVSTLGLYLQDQITLFPNLKLLLGGRYDFYRSENNFFENFGGDIFSESNEVNGEAFSPRAGLVYQPIEPISLYVSFSRSFIPNNATTRDGELIEPQRGTQYEVGIKTDLTQDISATLAAYQITKTNILTTDPIDDDFSIPVGEVRSRGLEFDIGGEILPGWNLTASAFLNDTAITEDNDLPAGDTLINAPGTGASLWTTYEIQAGDLKGLGFGAGIFYVGGREAELPNEFVLPSYVRADASIFYRRDRWKVGVNFKNLFDTRYFESSQNTRLIYPGAPFTILGTVSVQF